MKRSVCPMVFGLWFMVIVALLIGGLSMPCQAQAAKKLLIMDSQDGEPYSTAREAMLKELAAQGYTQGQNLEVVRLSIGNDKEKGKEMLTGELGKNYDAIYVNGTVMVGAAKDVALGKAEHKFVFVCVTDPVGMGVIDNFQDGPKANFTGVCYPVPVKARLKFVLDTMPQVKTIGLIYADMPQSQSYKKWIEDALATTPEYKNLKVIFRSVPLITGEDGSKKMAEAAQAHVKELDGQVDVFISPNDQMGVKKPFAEMVYANATKPLIGLGVKDVMESWGATMVVYPSQESAGTQTAGMIKRLFAGEPVSAIKPEWPKKNGFAFDLNKTKQFNVKVPLDLIELAGKNVVTSK